jgi:secreted trypsin-like serine protease
MKRTILVLGVLAAVLAVAAGGAWAGSRYVITSQSQVKPNTLTGKNIKNGTVGLYDLNDAAKTKLGKPGFAGAFYSVQTYAETVGVGAIATAACDPGSDTSSQKYVAISGGVQDTDSSTDMTANNDQVAVAASYPGRMDWDTNTPKAGRLDGWIVQFGHVGSQDNNLAVWALCVPSADFGGSLPVHTN